MSISDKTISYHIQFHGRESTAEGISYEITGTVSCQDPLTLGDIIQRLYTGNTDSQKAYELSYQGNTVAVNGRIYNKRSERNVFVQEARHG